MAALEEAFEATPADEIPAGSELRALSLMNVGIVELWVGQPDAARQHFEDALARVRRVSHPFVEVGCRAHLAIAAPLTGQPLPRALELSEQALAIADEHGWSSQSMTTGAFAMAGMALVRMGRFPEAERHLVRAGEALRVAADPGTEVLLQHARGILRFGQGRFDEALTELDRVGDLERLLASEHVFTNDARARAVQVRVRMGDSESAHRMLAGASPYERERALMRIAQAGLDLADDNPEQAVESLAPVIERPVALYERWARVEALILDAAARDSLGDRRAVGESLERALELAEPEGLILPFMLWPSRSLLEGHPKHSTAHGAFITTILDVLATGAAAAGGPLAPLRDEMSQAEMRVVRYLPSNLTASGIASELLVSTNTVRTHMRHIYAKLDAHSRAEAVERARELGLLAPSRLG
jgi:LuxR family maltose regulon positive regulatory protein